MVCPQKPLPRSLCSPEYEASTHNVIRLVQKAGRQVQHAPHSAACEVTPPLALTDSKNSPPKRGGAAKHAVSLLQYGACEPWNIMQMNYLKYSHWASDNCVHCKIGTAYLCARGSESLHYFTCNIGVSVQLDKHFSSYKRGCTSKCDC